MLNLNLKNETENHEEHSDLNPETGFKGASTQNSYCVEQRRALSWRKHFINESAEGI